MGFGLTKRKQKINSTLSQYNIISIPPQLLSSPPGVREAQLKAALGTFLFMFFQWHGSLKGHTECVLQEQPASGISTQTYRWHLLKYSWNRKPSKSFMGKCPMCLKCQRGLYFCWARNCTAECTTGDGNCPSPKNVMELLHRRPFPSRAEQSAIISVHVVQGFLF